MVQLFLITILLGCTAGGATVGAMQQQAETGLKWSRLAMAGSILPLAFITDAWMGMQAYRPGDVSDPGDSPVYVFLGSIMIAPVLLLVGMGLASLGFRMALAWKMRRAGES